MTDAHRDALAQGEQAGSRYTLALPRNIPSGLAGMQLGNRAGASIEFKDHRDYQPGDDLRHIDWSAYARSDRLTVKLFREEVNPHLDLLLDGSRSMALGETAKARAALGLAAAFVAAAQNAGYTHRAYLAADACEPVAHGADRPSAWDGVEFTAVGSLHASIDRSPPRWSARSMRVLLSDLLFMGEPLGVLEPIAYGSAAVFVVQLLAEADVEPPMRGNVRLIDCESHELKEVYVDAAAQQRYRNNLARHQEHWAAAAKKVGAVMTTVVAERLVEAWAMDAMVEAGMMQVA